MKKRAQNGLKPLDTNLARARRIMDTWGFTYAEQACAFGFDECIGSDAKKLESWISESRDARLRAAYIIGLDQKLQNWVPKEVEAHKKWLESKRKILGNKSVKSALTHGNFSRFQVAVSLPHLTTD